MMLRLEGEPDGWFAMHDLPTNTPYYLIWQQGINWQGILNDIQTSPLPYDKAAEADRKRENIQNRKDWEFTILLQ